MAAGRPIGYLDLCAGIGGFACAMHRVAPEAARCVGYSEILPAALECYARNFPDAPVLGDATAVARWPASAEASRDLLMHLLCQLNADPMTDPEVRLSTRAGVVLT